MDTNQIKTFLLVSRKRNLSMVATELGINQTTVGRQIRELERQIGFSLIEKGCRGVVLTEQGKKFSDLWTKLIAQLEYEMDFIKEFGESVQGSITIVTGIGTFLQITPGIFDFINQYPKINLKFQMIFDPFKIQMGEVDILLLPSESVSHLGLIEHKIFEAHFRIYASEAYLKTHGYPKNIEDLKNHRIIIYKNPAEQNLSKKLNVDLPYSEKIDLSTLSYLEVNHILAAEAALHSGFGIGIYWKQKAENQDPLVDLFPDLPSSVISYSCCYHPKLKDSPKIKAFLDFFIDFFEKNQNLTDNH